MKSVTLESVMLEIVQHEFSCYSLGFEIGTWYVLVSFGKRSWEIKLKAVWR